MQEENKALQQGIVHPIECEAPNDQITKESFFRSNIKYLLVGIAFGVIFVKGEIISWYRIQEMFRLDSFHMYGVIGASVAVAALSIWLIKRFDVKTVQKEKVVFHDKTFHWGNVIGALLFGLGWSITGACPGPIYAQIGSGFWPVLVTLMSALTGTWVYGLLRDRLPH